MITDVFIKEEVEDIKVSIAIATVVESQEITIEHPKCAKKKIIYYCNQCDHIAKNSRNLKMHMDANHKGVVFMCDQCDYSTRHKSNLNTHQKVKHEKRVYNCLHCEVTTSFKQYLQKHMKEKHGVPVMYFCSHCEYCNEDKQEYMLHKKTEHSPIHQHTERKPVKRRNIKENQQSKNNINASLSIGNDISNTEVFLVEPKSESSSKQQFICEKCDYSTDRRHNLTLHNKAVHEGSMDFYCEACPFSTTTKGYLHRHTLLMHKELSTKRIYPLCTPSSQLPDHKFFNTPGNRLPRLFIDGFLLRMNKFFLNEKEEKCAYFYCANKDKHKCKVSAKAFVGNVDVHEPKESIYQKNEMMTSIDKIDETKGIVAKDEVNDDISDPLLEVLVKTEECDQEESEENTGMSLMSYLGIHTEKCTQNSLEEILKKRTRRHDLKCDMCEYESISAGGLEKHREAKHDKITYSCDKCDFTVKYKSSLRRHISAIHEGKAYYCNLCDHRATTASHLRTHVESQHDGIKYECESCGKLFKQKVHLKIHDDTMHKGVTHSCTYCPYVARQKGHLNHHIKTKHLGQPHKCDICGVIYSHNGQLKFHMVRDHGSESDKNKFMCDKCSFFTSEEKYLTRHIKRKHEKSEDERKKSKGHKRKSKRIITKSVRLESSQIKTTLSVDFSESKDLVEHISVEEVKLKAELLLIQDNLTVGTETKPFGVITFIEETKLEEELLLEEDIIAETKFSVLINNSL